VYDKAADLNDRPKLFLSRSSSICSDLADGGKLGYGFMSADELEEVNIGHGQYLLAKSLTRPYESR
jgi:hypothetical protein